MLRRRQLRSLNFATPSPNLSNSLHTHLEEEVAAAALRKDPVVKSRLREFTATDNWTNFLHIGKVYGIIALTLIGAVIFFEFRAGWGIAFGWNVPVFLVALFTIGASQHQLAGALHEAVHHTLFKNRTLNELASDWLCAFPILTSTYQFRLYHLAHHQFVNDPKRDPDFALLKDSGHWLDFPIAKTNFLWMMVRQIFLVELFRYIITRVRYNTVGSHSESPYRASDGQGTRIPARLVTGFFFFLIVSVFAVQRWGAAWQVIAIPAAGWIAVSVTLAILPVRFFEKARIKPVFHPRWIFIGQTFSFAVIVTGLGFIQMTSEFMALRYFSMLWYGAILTTFPFFMILRQLVQHGNGDRGWLTNTRVFRMIAPVRYAVFPFGMDYHLPHHMYASVPHYRLRALHDFLMTVPRYSDHCQLVDNYLVPKKNFGGGNPTVVEVLGPGYAATSENVHIDDTVLDDWEVEEKDAILKSGRPLKAVPREDPPVRDVETKDCA